MVSTLCVLNQLKIKKEIPACLANTSTAKTSTAEVLQSLHGSCVDTLNSSVDYPASRLYNNHKNAT